jgi:hypothetical protein
MSGRFVRAKMPWNASVARLLVRWSRDTSAESRPHQHLWAQPQGTRQDVSGS